MSTTYLGACSRQRGNKENRLLLKAELAYIKTAIQTAATDDIVLIAGKGHEDYQQVGELRLAFSDAVQVRLALGEAGA